MTVSQRIGRKAVAATVGILRASLQCSCIGTGRLCRWRRVRRAAFALSTAERVGSTVWVLVYLVAP
jgi:hypothetical protein